jgi:hypothetical protein
MQQINKTLFIILFIFNILICKSQFHPQVGFLGTSAIHKDSSIIKSWATNCFVKRGFQDITNLSLGYASAGDSSMAIGIADGSGIVSLGDGGEAILTFNSPIKNGSGPDFCVFENAFDPGFLELATVSVSSDGINFFEFQSTSNTQFTTQVGPFDAVIQADKLNNLAGKYIANYGTPFDLQELASISTLNINSITHIKIKDVVGCVNCINKTLDKNLNPINDPFPTAFASSGFDLDAVGVINQIPLTLNQIDDFKNSIKIKHNYEGIIITNNFNEKITFCIYNNLGQQITINQLEPNSSKQIKELLNGAYLLNFYTSKLSYYKKIIK